MHFVQTLAGVVLWPWADRARRGDPALHRALTVACARGWQVLEIALVGDPFWDRLAALLSAKDEQRLIQEARSACDRLPAELMPFGKEIQRHCLRELWRARRIGLLPAALPPLNSWADDLARFAEPAQRPAAEQHALSTLAGELVHSGCPYLAELLTAGPTMPLPIRVARAVLDRSLAGNVFPAEDFAGLATLHQVLDRDDAVFPLLEETRSAVEQEHPAALDLFEEWRWKGDTPRDAYQAVWDAQRRLGRLRTRLTAGAAVPCVTDAAGQRAVKQALARCRALPRGERAGRPALLNAAAKLYLAVGDAPAAVLAFGEVLAVAADPAVQAEVHANVFQAALAAGNRDQALQSLLQAVKLGGAHYALFPLDRFAPHSIMCADARGATFLCRRLPGGEPVLVRTLSPETLGRPIETVFADAAAARAVGHPAILGAQEGSFAEPDCRDRAYLVLDYFPGATLGDHVHRNGVLKAAQVMDLAQPLAQALEVAHRKNLGHGEVGPGSILVRPPVAPRTTWEVKLTDFGLAGPVEEAADVEGLGRACCFALFKNSQPAAGQWRKVPARLAELLRGCLGVAGKRPANFDAVVEALRLAALPTTPAVKAPPRPKPAPPRPRNNPLAPPPRVRPPRNPWANPDPSRLGVAGVVSFLVFFVFILPIISGVFSKTSSPSTVPVYIPPTYTPPNYNMPPPQVWIPPNYKPGFTVPTVPSIPYDPGVYGPTVPYVPGQPGTVPIPGVPVSPYNPGGVNPYGQGGTANPYGPGVPPVPRR